MEYNQIINSYKSLLIILSSLLVLLGLLLLLLLLILRLKWFMIGFNADTSTDVLFGDLLFCKSSRLILLLLVKLLVLSLKAWCKLKKSSVPSLWPEIIWTRWDKGLIASLAWKILYNNNNNNNHNHNNHCYYFYHCYEPIAIEHASFLLSSSFISFMLLRDIMMIMIMMIIMMLTMQAIPNNVYILRKLLTTHR